MALTSVSWLLVCVQSNDGQSVVSYHQDWHQNLQSLLPLFAICSFLLWFYQLIFVFHWCLKNVTYPTLAQLP